MLRPLRTRRYIKEESNPGTLSIKKARQAAGFFNGRGDRFLIRASLERAHDHFDSGSDAEFV